MRAPAQDPSAYPTITRMPQSRFRGWQPIAPSTAAVGRLLVLRVCTRSAYRSLKFPKPMHIERMCRKGTVRFQAKAARCAAVQREHAVCNTKTGYCLSAGYCRLHWCTLIALLCIL